MADRLRSLRRIEKVQRQMVRLSEWRLAAAARARAELAADQARLQDYLAGEDALGETFAKAALRSLHGLDRRIGAAERVCDASKAALDAAKRREHMVSNLVEDERKMARRADEDRDLATTIETWLTRQTSLP